MGISCKYWYLGAASNYIEDNSDSKYWQNGQANGVVNVISGTATTTFAISSEDSTAEEIFSGAISTTVAVSSEDVLAELIFSGTCDTSFPVCDISANATVTNPSTSTEDTPSNGHTVQGVWGWLPIDIPGISRQKKKKKPQDITGAVETRFSFGVKAIGRISNPVNGSGGVAYKTFSSSGLSAIDNSLPEQWKREDEELLEVLQLIGEYENA